MFRKGYIGIAICVCLLGGCSASGLDKAREIVMQADSMRAEGKMYCDSAVLAQAYTALHSWRDIYPTDYAHACYHYGRLLREKDDPVGAMQVFINATHSRTRDNHILGRVYSNMGSICHLANEFPLSYAMYEKSADCFLKNGDTINYYYALNDMAYELAEQGKKEETLHLLSLFNSIPTQKISTYLYAKTIETKAILYRKIGQNDSILDCINLIHSFSYLEPNTIILKAQAFDNLGNQDSALYYAQMILDNPSASPQNKFNALYIVKRRDSTLCAKDIDALCSQREDIRFYEYEPVKEKMILSSQLLQQDLSRKPDWKWLYAVCITIVVISIILILNYRRKRRQHMLLSQQVEDLEGATFIAKEKHEELTNRYHAQREHIVEEMTHMCSLLHNDSNVTETLYWTDFDKMCSFVDQQFFMFASILRQKYNLNETEVRLCVLVLIGFSRAQIAQTLPYASNSVGKLKDQTAKKLGSTGKKLHDFLVKTAIEK